MQNEVPLPPRSLDSRAATEEVQPDPARQQGSPAAPLVEQGINLLDQGKAREAVDSFTKAIAQDGNYREAWERRAQAYDRLGDGRRQRPTGAAPPLSNEELVPSFVAQIR